MIKKTCWKGQAVLPIRPGLLKYINSILITLFAKQLVALLSKVVQESVGSSYCPEALARQKAQNASTPTGQLPLISSAMCLPRVGQWPAKD